jgi:hypothetical protein
MLLSQQLDQEKNYRSGGNRAGPKSSSFATLFAAAFLNE